jgi:hypothetical protein
MTNSRHPNPPLVELIIEQQLKHARRDIVIYRNCKKTKGKKASSGREKVREP